MAVVAAVAVVVVVAMDGARTDAADVPHPARLPAEEGAREIDVEDEPVRVGDERERRREERRRCAAVLEPPEVLALADRGLAVVFGAVLLVLQLEVAKGRVPREAVVLVPARRLYEVMK